jgi:hypothetical protein
MNTMTEHTTHTPGDSPWVNPLRDPRDLRLPRIAGPCSIVIFGVTGDLFRIDHYLGKETVQNLMALRFANACSSRSGTGATSTMCRSRLPRPTAWRGPLVGTTTRPALRDMVQNHLLQLLCLVGHGSRW